MFDPYFTIKDAVFIVFSFLLFIYFVGFYPNYLSHPDNYIPADSLVTPTHIVPE
jgi:ubiquinol-cytochrome c reductase cytochrome b subunit